MSFFISDAWAQGGATNAATTGVFNIVLLFVFVGMFYFLLLRPQLKRAKQPKQMVEALAKGDEVVSSGGLLGKVAEVEESFVVVEVAKGMEVRLQKGRRLRSAQGDVQAGESSRLIRPSYESISCLEVYSCPCRYGGGLPVRPAQPLR